MPKANLKQQALTLIEQLSNEKLKAAVDYLTYIHDKEVWDATHELVNNAEIVKSLERAETDEKTGRLLNWTDVKRNV